MYARYIKRILDFILSLSAIVVLSPILLILIVLGAIFMRGNPFFTQLRPGKDEKIFKLIKFRTMDNRKDRDGNLLPDDIRLNKYGRILRSTSLDELPELLNIIKGDMSIVGPRPQLVKDMVFMSDEVRKRHLIRPGLTGLAQVSGRNNISWEQKFVYDLMYLDDVRLLSDVEIIFKTVFKVFFRKDIVREGTQSDVDYGEWLLNNHKITNDYYIDKLAQADQLLGRD